MDGFDGVPPPAGLGCRGLTPTMSAAIEMTQHGRSGQPGGRRQPIRPPAHPRAGRIPGLDGLRAFAVVAVLVFHLWPSALPGGFLGVDVFFVISGFLITTLLIRERRSAGSNDLKGFWKRRARRLLPAVVLVVVSSVAAARLVAPDLLVNIRRQVFGAMTFSTNWVEVIAGADYFDHSSPSLFVTFWSLAVEEQFYIVWPLVSTALSLRSRRLVGLWPLPLAVAVASAALMAFLFDPAASSTRVYYGTDTHVFGIMIGVALAFAFSGPVAPLRSRRWRRARPWIGPLALLALAAMTVVMGSESRFTYRGGILLASILAALLVATLPGRPITFVMLLHAKPLVWIGQRSYGIYLWHWPVLLLTASVMPATAPGAGPRWTTAVLVLAITLALSEASYRWVELPVIRDGFRATIARTVGGLRVPRPASGAVHHWRFALGSIVVLIALVGLLTAPDKTEMQRSVEAGQRAIEQQAPPGSADTVPRDSHGAADNKMDADNDGTTPAHQPAWPADQPLPPGDAIVGFGDSVLSGAAPAMYEKFPGIYLDAKPIRQWKDAPGVVRSVLDAGTMRNVVVLNFGTNAGLRSDESIAALQATLDELGPERRVVLVTIGGTSPWVGSSNETLRQQAAGRSNVIVADWRSAVMGRPDLLHTDKTHPNMEGIKVYADVVAAAIGQLGPGG